MGQIQNLHDAYRQFQNLADEDQSLRQRHPRPAETFQATPDTSTTTHRVTQDWLDEYAWMAAAEGDNVRGVSSQEYFDELFEENMQIGGRNERITDAFPQDAQVPNPRSRRFNAQDVSSRVGKVLDVVELGINAWKFRVNVDSERAAQQALEEAMQEMKDDRVYSVFKQFELECFRNVIVRRRADNLYMVMSAAMTLLGWIPVGGWIFSIANFVAGIVVNRAADRIRDFLEPGRNPAIIEDLRSQLSGRSYDQAFPANGNSTQKGNRKLIQFIIRAKILYDLRRLVDRFNPDMPRESLDYHRNELDRENMYKMIGLLVRKERWYMHKDVVFGTSPTWFFISERDNRIQLERPSYQPDRYVPVHFQDYFPIECYCGTLRQFQSWFKDDLMMEVHINFELTGEFEIRFKNFEQVGFDNRVWAFVFEISGMGYERRIEMMRPGNLDVHGDGWARSLASRLDDIQRSLADADNFDTALRGDADGVYRRNEGETISRDSEEIPHVRSGPDGCLAARIFHSFELNNNGYLILMLTDTEQSGQGRGEGDILYMKFQFLFGEERAYDGRAPEVGPCVWDIEDNLLVKGDRRHQFRGS